MIAPLLVPLKHLSPCFPTYHSHRLTPLYSPSAYITTIIHHRGESCLRDAPGEPRACRCRHHWHHPARPARRCTGASSHACVTEPRCIARFTSTCATDGMSLICRHVEALATKGWLAECTGHIPTLDAGTVAHVIPACDGRHWRSALCDAPRLRDFRIGVRLELPRERRPCGGGGVGARAGKLAVLMSVRPSTGPVVCRDYWRSN
jgi:hypothetical protein